jgi:hypothetical protein
VGVAAAEWRETVEEAAGSHLRDLLAVHHGRGREHEPLTIVRRATLRLAYVLGHSLSVHTYSPADLP